jgi:hypothetical protein
MKRATGIGLLDAQPVCLDATEKPSNFFPKPHRQQFKDLLVDEPREELKEASLLGSVTSGAPHAEPGHRPDFLKDPRS